MVSRNGVWTYYQNTPEMDKCDCDRIADWIVEQGYKPKTTIENLVETILLHFGYDDDFSIENCIDFIIGTGIEKFDYYI